MNAAIRTENLSKFYGDKCVLFDLDLQVAEGTMFGFLGPNGAGKTTTLNILCTLLRPTRGSAFVAGLDVARAPFDVRRHISIVFQESTLDLDLSCVENLRFHCELLGIPKSDRARLIEEKLALVGLMEQASTSVIFLSGGMRRRLEIARGLLSHPAILFLDEPTAGLDTQTRIAVWEYLRNLVDQEGTTVFLTTHHLEEAENCSSIAILDGGKIVAEGAPSALKAAVGNDVVRLQTTDDDAVRAAIEHQLLLAVDSIDGALIFATPDVGRALACVYAIPEAHILSVNVTRPTLDDVFLKYTGTEIRDRAYSNSVSDMIERGYE